LHLRLRRVGERIDIEMRHRHQTGSDETGGRDKTAMQATSILLVIVALAGLAYVWV